MKEKKTKTVHSDKCSNRTPDCFAFGVYGKCKACSDTNFKHGCPFYKTNEQRQKEHEQSIRKLENIGRYDLIGKFGESENQPRVWGEIYNG